MMQRAQQAGEPRRHGLDALRAFAMLLGVGLHAALTFFPTVWPVQDRTAGYHGPWEEMFFAVHGFRMPAFFLLSGFFTAMLWRRRGLPALIRHRLRRVALPLALAMVTVGPAMDWVVARALGSEAKDLSLHKLLPRLGEFHHLWFLWMLLWLLGGFLVVAFVADRVCAQAPGGDGAAQPAWPRWVMWLLIPLTLLPQLGMAGGGAYPMFGPDTNTGLLPSVHLLAYYAAFFAYGALAYGRRDRTGALLADTLGRRWRAVLPVSVLVVLPAGLAVTFLPEVRSWAASQVLQVLYAWGMCLGLIGLFRVVLTRERPSVRYLADASYWIYLVHLPLVIGAQIVIRDWALPSGIKFLLITGGVTAVLLLSYQAFVRYTPIGTLLNGRKRLPAYG